MKSFSRHRHRQARRGMVLMEVIVALTIFAMVAVSLVVALNSALDVAKERNQIEVAMQGLGNQMALLRGSHVVMVDKDLPDDGSGVLYHITVQSEQAQDELKRPVPNLYRATITANWKANGKPEDRSLSVLLYQP